MKTGFSILLGLLCSVWAQAQSSVDIAAIKGQCGCFDVDFKYAETFSPIPDYKFHDRYHAQATEYAFAIEESDRKIVIQHILVIEDTTVVKHWREDWIYEDPNAFNFYKDKTWIYAAGDAAKIKNTWTQKVFEVDDGPRYQGRALWFHTNDSHLWESKADAPLPRREYTKRSDYNVLRRGNRIYIRPDGYMHEQDNDKLIRAKMGVDSLITQEKGYNWYRRIETSKCTAAQQWWEKNQSFWADVRAGWQEVFDKKANFSLKPKVDDKRLHNYFEELEKQHKDHESNRTAIRAILARFVVFNTEI